MRTSPEPNPYSAHTLPVAGLSLALGLAALGQWSLLHNDRLLGLGGYVLAAVLLAAVLARFSPPLPGPVFSAISTLDRWPRLMFTTLALVLFTVQGVDMADLKPTEQRLILAAWLLSVGVFCLTVLWTARWRPPRLADIAAGLRAHWREIAGLTLLTLGALALRVYLLEIHPYAFANDEGWVGLEAWRMLKGVHTQLFDVGWGDQPLLSFMPNVLTVWLLGNTAFAVRIVSAVEGTLTVVCLYLLAREAFGIAVAFLAAGVLAALPVHIHFSRTGFNNIIPGLYGALVLWLTFRALRRGRVSSYLWPGLAAGLTLYAYLGSRLALLLAVGTLAYVALRQRDYLRTHIPHLLVFSGAMGVTMAPMAAFFVIHRAEFMGRLNGENILLNGWLAHEAAIRAQGLPQILWDQLMRSSLVFVSTGAPSGFYSSPHPYLTWLGAIFFVLGMGYALLRVREPFYLALLAWFWLVIVLAGVLTSSAPASQRLVMSLPAAAVFIALGLREVVRLLERLDLIPRSWGLAACASVVLVTGLQGVQFYFGEYRRANYYGDASNEMIFESTQAMRQLGPDYRLYLLGQPRVYLQFANFDYFLPDFDKQELDSVTPEMLRALPRDKGALFVAIPEQQANLELIAQTLPGGQGFQFSRRYRPEVLYFAYQLPPVAPKASAREKLSGDE